MSGKKKNTTTVSDSESEQYWLDKYKKAQDIMQRYSQYVTEGGMTISLKRWAHHIHNDLDKLSDEEAQKVRIVYSHIVKLKGFLVTCKSKLKKINGGSDEADILSRKTEILELYGKHYTTPEIHKYMMEKGFNLSLSMLSQFYHKHREQITAIRNEADKDLGDITISNKRSRLSTLNYMLMRTKQEYDKEDGLRMLPYGDRMQKILEQAKKEVEGEEIKLNINGSINITATLEGVKSIEKLYADINFMTLLMSRVAARMNINPFMLLYRLTNSWYAKFTGIKKNKFLMDEIPNYPSTLILDWKDLQERAEEKQKADRELEERFAQEVAYEEVRDSDNDIRKALLKKIRERQGSIDGATSKEKRITRKFREKKK